ncbi:MAG TPA: hypothetical protein VNU22_08545 [Candidatus Acidoferrum sp.]|jgi:hypothetical protein|nr:hypothetical protein [Candidatus Acidoferrum sp.]
MIAAIVAAAAPAPSKGALIERWLRANRAHVVVRLAPASAPPISAPDLRALAQREFAVKGRYRLAESPAAATAEPWWLQALHWIYQRWQRFWDLLFARVRVGPQGAASLGDVLLLLVGILMIFVVVRLLRNLQVERARSAPQAAPLQEPPAPRTLYQQACNAAGRGDYGAASLLLFAATVALLDRQGAVDGTASATVGDLRRELRAGNAGLVTPFDAVAAPFVQEAYAERAVDEPQWHRARDAFATLLQEGAQP